MNVLFVPDDGSPALPVLVGGEPEKVDEERAKEILSEGKFEIKIQLGIGEESAKYWTCDFSYVSLSLLSLETLSEGLHGNRTWMYDSNPTSPRSSLFYHCALCLCLRGTESLSIPRNT